MPMIWIPCIALQHLMAQCPKFQTSALCCRWAPWSRSIARRLVACTNISRSAHLSRQLYQMSNQLQPGLL